MNNKNLISVILPVYNSEKYIEESILSIINQTYSNFELIIINDGSSDNSFKICKSYSEKDKRINLINNSHKGLTPSLNQALKIAKGKYIARQDADDISEKKRFAEQIKWFEKNLNGVLCGTDCLIKDENNNDKKNLVIKFEHKKILQVLNYSNCFVHTSVMFHKEAALKFNGYDENFTYAQDYDLWWKLGTIGQVGNLKEKLVTIRQRKNSISSNKSSKQTEDFIRSAVKYYAYKKKIVSEKDTRNIEFYEKNQITKSKLAILRFFYNDKTENKIFFKNLNFKEKLMIFRYPKLLVRKLYKF